MKLHSYPRRMSHAEAHWIMMHRGYVYAELRNAGIDKPMKRIELSRTKGERGSHVRVIADGEMIGYIMRGTAMPRTKEGSTNEAT